MSGAVIQVSGGRCGCLARALQLRVATYSGVRTPVDSEAELREGASVTDQAPLSSDQQSRLLSFLGFGNPEAPVVFIGTEEGLTETASYSLLQQLHDRAKLPSVVGLRKSGVHARKFLAGPRPPIQTTWNSLVCVLLALDGRLSPDNDEVRLYQRDKLGRSSGNAQLLEFLPLPAKNSQFWSPYDSYFPQFPTRDSYTRTMRPIRRAALRNHLAYGPRLVVCYGSAYWDDFKALFSSIDAWRSEDVFEYGKHEGTAVVLMPHPVSRQMNGKRNRLCSRAVKLYRRS
jgi:hypothetical protein